MKKVLVTLLIAVMTVMVVGCESNTGVNKGTESGKVPSSEPPSSSEMPTPTEAPIVKVVGTVEDAAYNKAVAAFEGIVEKLRTDGLVQSSDVCVIMDGTDFKVDITFDNEDVDLSLIKDVSTNIYTLTLDYNFTWLENLGPTVNGKDPALYNKELLVALLSMVSNDSEILFSRIDLDYHSAAGLSNTKWTEIGDCFILSGEIKVDEYISYHITTEEKDTRDATFVLTGTRADGSTFECVIEYDSSLLSYEMIDNNSYIEQVYGFLGDKVPYMGVLDESKMGPNCYPAIKTGISSYENYKKNWVDKHVAKGDPNAGVTEYSSHTVNGYTYYWMEGFYRTETEIGDPDIVYVQIGENEYIELYNVLFEERFEDFINSSFYVKEVK